MASNVAIETSLQEPMYDISEPLVVVVPEMEADKLVRARAARFIGACVTGQYVEQASVEAQTTVQPIESLYEAIHLAAEGDPTAHQMIETNARTDVIERTIKAGHVITVDLNVDQTGKIQQHGQSMESVQANSLRLASRNRQMRARTEAEATNAFRIEQLHRQGILNEYSFVVFSRAADNMTEQEMTDAGFFTDTMSTAIQVTTVKDGKLTTESAFIAGVKRPGEERYDADAVDATVEYFGANLHDKSATGTINTPILIPNKLIPNGAVDIVEVYDEQNGTFFGEDKLRQNYLEYRKKCQRREQLLTPKVDAIVEELISEAPQITTPIKAVQRLHKISEKHMVEQAAFDHSINPRVFGSVAADHIEQAREQFALGNNDAGLDSLNQAKSTATSSSCPSSLDSSEESSDSDSDIDGESNDDKECEYVSKECPMCGEKNVKTKVTKTRITGSCGCSKVKELKLAKAA